MTEPDEHAPLPEPPAARPKRAVTFLGRQAQALREQNWVVVVVELGIVVLGVLIGLQANNWNETRKTENDVHALIRNLHSEFVSNRTSLGSTRDDLDAIMASSREVLSLVGRRDIEMSDTELDSLIELTFFWPTWMPSNSVSQELTNSGMLSDLDDDAVKPLLFEWERTMRQVNEWNRRMERSSQDLIDYVKDNGSLRNTNHARTSIGRSSLTVRNRQLLADPRFENYLDEKLVMAQFLAYQYRQADELTDEIIRESGRYVDRGASPPPE